MYIDSTNHDIPDGDVTVSKKLKEYVEPLLLVSVHACVNTVWDIFGIFVFDGPCNLLAVLLLPH